MHPQHRFHRCGDHPDPVFRGSRPAGPLPLHRPRPAHVSQALQRSEVPAPVPRGVGFSCVIESDVPVVVQHTRLDSRQAENSIMTTIASPL
nr:sensory rhodopsin transducer [Stenotrophomonas sp. SAM-B]